MRRPSPRQIARFADYAVPWGVGIFLALVAIDDSESPSSTGVVLLGLALAAIQGGALRWRRRKPELVMAVTVAGGLAFQPSRPSSWCRSRGSSRSARSPPRGRRMSPSSGSSRCSV